MSENSRTTSVQFKLPEFLFSSINNQKSLSNVSGTTFLITPMEALMILLTFPIGCRLAQTSMPSMQVYLDRLQAGRLWPIFIIGSSI